MNAVIEKLLTELPDSPGIYLFYDTQGELIYVGKATSLTSRVRSYFRGKRTPRPIENMIHEVVRFETKTTDSALEAVILEGVYIKKYLPKYNVMGKDNKSWNYLVLTKETYPHLRSLREHDLKLLGARERAAQFREEFGPYPGLNMRAALKTLRRLFVISSCTPDEGRPCLYRQMGQCLGVCTGEITPKEYEERVIRPLTLFLRGEKKRLIRELERCMKKLVKEEKFEEATRVRDQLRALMHIHDVALLNDSFVEDVGLIRAHRGGEVESLRIEGYDISNLGSTGKVGSMVVFDGDGPVKSQYRKFNIKTVEGQSDVDCLKEVLARRFTHPEWPQPTLLLIDGGRPQVNAAHSVMQSLGLTIPVVGIAKGPERKRNDFIFAEVEAKTVEFVSTHQPLLIRVRDEAHRFAITFQRSKRRITR